MGPNDTMEIRRALDRLQQSFEVMSDKYRDLRRERKQLRERIEELHRERDRVGAANAAQLEMAETDRARAIDLEQRVTQAEHRSEELSSRAADLEQSLKEREALIAEQEDVLAQLRQELTQGRAKDEETWMQGEHQREEIDDLRRQLGQIRAESESYRTQLEQVTAVGEGEVVLPASALEEMRTESASLRGIIAQLRDERSEFESRHLQAIGKLDAATLAETMARTESAALQQEKTELEDALAAQREAHARLELKLAEAAERVPDTADDARLEEREREIGELHAALGRKQESHAAEVAQFRDRLAAVDVERERLEQQAGELRGERDSARLAAESLKLSLQQAESGDDERLRAQRTRIEELQRELGQALDIAARKEVEVDRALQDLEIAQERFARLNEEMEQLKAEPVAANGTAVNGLTLGDDERRQIAEQIDTAIRIIDKHLQSE